MLLLLPWLLLPGLLSSPAAAVLSPPSSEPNHEAGSSFRSRLQTPPCLVEAGSPTGPPSGAHSRAFSWGTFGRNSLRIGSWRSQPSSSTCRLEREQDPGWHSAPLARVPSSPAGGLERATSTASSLSRGGRTSGRPSMLSGCLGCGGSASLNVDRNPDVRQFRAAVAAEAASQHAGIKARLDDEIARERDGGGGGGATGSGITDDERLLSLRHRRRAVLHSEALLLSYSQHYLRPWDRARRHEAESLREQLGRVLSTTPQEVPELDRFRNSENLRSALRDPRSRSRARP